MTTKDVVHPWAPRPAVLPSLHGGRLSFVPVTKGADPEYAWALYVRRPTTGAEKDWLKENGWVFGTNAWLKHVGTKTADPAASRAQVFIDRAKDRWGPGWMMLSVEEREAFVAYEVVMSLIKSPAAGTVSAAAIQAVAAAAINLASKP